MFIPKAIYISAGHGGYTWWGTQDKGASYNGFNERDLMVKLARKVIKILKHKDELKTTNIFDVGVETNARSLKKVKYINQSIKMSKYNNDDCLYFDLHLNSAKQKAS